jgi:hypothetical protein
MCIESRCIRGFAKIIVPPLHLSGAPKGRDQPFGLA